MTVADRLIPLVLAYVLAVALAGMVSRLLWPAARRAVRAARARLATSPPPGGRLAAALHGRHARIPAQRTPKDH